MIKITSFTSIILMFLSTLLAVLYLYLLKANETDHIIMSSAAKIIRLKDKISTMQRRIIVQQNNTYINKKQLLRLKRELSRLQKKYLSVQHNRYANKNPITHAGFALIDFLKLNNTNKYYRKLNRSVAELYGKSNALVITNTLLAEAAAYLIVGLCIVLTLSVIALESLPIAKALLIAVLGIIIVLIAVYAIFDSIFYRVKQRKNNLLLDFPQAINKLALLVNAGIELTDAWKQTAYSSYGELYLEMQSVCKSLDNGIPLKAAYKDFIDRCNSKQIAKLGVAIEQAHIKGNRELSKALVDICTQVWEERKHKARRIGELANSKLLLPILMIFSGIMMMIIVPIMANLGI